MKLIDISVTKTGKKLKISMFNDGRGIPIEIEPKEKIYVPELIFGHLLTGSNFNDAQASTPWLQLNLIHLNCFRNGLLGDDTDTVLNSQISSVISSPWKFTTPPVS